MLGNVVSWSALVACLAVGRLHAQDFQPPADAAFVNLGSPSKGPLEYADSVLSALSNSIIDTSFNSSGNMYLQGNIEGVDFEVTIQTFSSDYGTDGSVYGVTCIVYDPPPPTATDMYFSALQMKNPARLIQTMYHEILHIWLAQGFPELSESEDPDCQKCEHIIINIKMAEDLCASANCCATAGCETSDPPLSDGERTDLVAAANAARTECITLNSGDPCGSACDAPKPTTQPQCPPSCDKLECLD